MDRVENANEGDSSPDTVIARSSSEEDGREKPRASSTSGEYVTVGNSSSSLDTLTSGSGGGDGAATAHPSGVTNADDARKRSRLVGALRSGLREGGSIFGIKRRVRANETKTSRAPEAHPEQDDRGFLPIAFLRPLSAYTSR